MAIVFRLTPKGRNAAKIFNEGGVVEFLDRDDALAAIVVALEDGRSKTQVEVQTSINENPEFQEQGPTLKTSPGVSKIRVLRQKLDLLTRGGIVEKFNL